ncbi:MAG TPA: GlsB/YeaQ/YmgE family stress response membrane protein [Candidatus Limnocylindrales bacterium]|jgi:uncharacterized membrane protein YeaQ/YmgE (transglycosylase-associated protein family)|nr:GlsB/YeaQ/YmgE family stress response membrane protein [Candidatus Limnocylindrales bacterium]
MDMGLVGWIVIGFIAGSISGWIVGDRSARGCLPKILVGIVGGILGGWLSRELGFGDVQGFFGAVVFASAGAILVRVVLRALESR